MMSLFLTLFLALRAQASPGVGLSLDQVLQQVDRNNPEIAAARAMAEAGQSMVLASWSLPDPQVGVTFNNFPRSGLDLSQSQSRSLDLIQELPFPGKQLLASRQAGAEADAKRASLERVRADQRLEARRMYWELEASQASAQVLSRSAASLGELVALSQERDRFGATDRMAQLMDPMARMQQAAALNALASADADAWAARQALKRLMGLGAAAALPELALAGEQELFQAGDDHGALLKKALSAAPEVKEALAALASSQARQEVALAGWLPSFMLQYSLMQDQSGMASGMAMARMSVPLWFTRPWGEASAAGHEATAAQSMAASARLSSQEAFESAWAKRQAGREQWRRFQQQILPLSQQAGERGIAGYRAGSVGVADALSAVLAYQSMNLDALMLQSQLGLLDATLLRLTGE
jgi:cobalt-zinc-cadmium efflux system outer membrane protein